MKPFDAFWLLRKEADREGTASYGENDRRLSGAVTLTSESREALQALGDKGDLPTLEVNGNAVLPSKLPETGTASFVARAPNAYFEDLPELIRRHPVAPPKDYRVYSIPDDEQKLEHYREACSLANILQALSVDSDKSGCIIVAREKLEIPFKYEVRDLHSLENLDHIYTLMVAEGANDADQQRALEIHRAFFRQALFDVLSGIQRDRRFSQLLEKLPECTFRHRLAFRRFTDEANTAIERYEEKRIGMISALNGVLGNIQTSLIGIPLAGLLALHEMEPSKGWTFGNGIIAIAAVIVGALLFALTLSQGRTLRAIREQYDHLVTEIADSGGSKTQLEVSLNSMSAHIRFVHFLVWVVRILIFGFIAVAVGALLLENIVAFWSAFKSARIQVNLPRLQFLRG